MDDDLLSKIVSEQIQRLNEELSVSKEVDDAVEQVCTKLKTEFEDVFNHHYNSMVLNIGDDVSIPMKYATFGCVVSIAGSVVNVITRLYEVIDEKYYEMIYQYVKPGGLFNLEEKRLEVRSLVYKGMPTPANQFYRGVLQHELAHACQEINANKKLFGKIYDIANGIIKDDSIPDNSFEKSLAWAIYYFSNVEVDTNVNGLYAEVSRLLSFKDELGNLSGSDVLRKYIGETNYTVEKKRRLELLDTVIEQLSSINDEEKVRVCQTYGFRNIKHLLSYLKNGRDRLKEKEGKVLALAFANAKLNEDTEFISYGMNNKVKLYIR